MWLGIKIIEVKMTKRKGIRHNTERLLWAMSAGRCEKCGRILYMHPINKVVGNFAQIAHNLPVGKNGPRSEYKTKTINPNANIDDVNNLLLLCYECHQEIDKIRPHDYPPEKLAIMKSDFEQFIYKATELERIVPTVVLKYSPNLHGQQQLIGGIHNALFPDKVKDKEMDITLKNSQFYVGDPNYWEVEEKNLINAFAKRVTPMIEDYKNGFMNISVFAIGPIPLLVKLGELLSNKHNIDVYQLKKSPKTWEWETGKEDTEYKINYIQECDNPKRVIAVFSISGKVKLEEVQSAIEWDDALVVEITANCNPYDDFLRTKRQLEKFVKCYQVLKEQIRNKSKTGTKVHVFAAVPGSIAVELGRQHNATFDLPLTVYNYENSKYEKAITIGGMK